MSPSRWAAAKGARPMASLVHVLGDGPVGPVFHVTDVVLMESDTRADGAVYREVRRPSRSSGDVPSRTHSRTSRIVRCRSTAAQPRDRRPRLALTPARSPVPAAASPSCWCRGMHVHVEPVGLVTEGASARPVTPCRLPARPSSRTLAPRPENARCRTAAVVSLCRARCRGPPCEHDVAPPCGATRTAGL